MSYKNRIMPRATLGRSASLPMVGHSSTKSSKHRDAFGAAMAHEIFALYEYGEECADTEYEPYEYEEAVKDNGYEHWWQPDLPLESQQELEDRLRDAINKFERGYQKMMVAALRWHYLQEDVAVNPQVEKLFKDMQLTRKLSGSDYV